MECDKCRLCSTAEHVCILGYGKQSARIMFIQDSPNEGDDHLGIPCSNENSYGKAGY